jgi:hypothetical protein
MPRGYPAGSAYRSGASRYGEPQSRPGVGFPANDNDPAGRMRLVPPAPPPDPVSSGAAGGMAGAAGDLLGAMGHLPGPAGAAARTANALMRMADAMQQGPRAIGGTDCGIWGGCAPGGGTQMIKGAGTTVCLGSFAACAGGQGSFGPNTRPPNLGESAMLVEWYVIAPAVGSNPPVYREDNKKQYTAVAGKLSAAFRPPQFLGTPGADSPPQGQGDPRGDRPPAEAPGARGTQAPGAAGAPDAHAAPHGLPLGSPAVNGRTMPIGQGSVRGMPETSPAARPNINPGRAPVIPARPDLLPIANPVEVPVPPPYVVWGDPARVVDPMVVPSPEIAPGVVPVPAPLPRAPGLPEPGRLPEPGVVPTPAPAPAPAPAPGPAPSPEPSPVGDPLRDPLPDGFPAPRPERSPEPERVADPDYWANEFRQAGDRLPRQEPSPRLATDRFHNMPRLPGVKEKKWRGMRALYAIVGQATELDESLECAWKSIPKKERSDIKGKKLGASSPTIYYWKKGWAKKHGKTDAQIEEHNKLFKIARPVHQKPQTMVAELMKHGGLSPQEMEKYRACESQNHATDFLVGRANQLANKGFMGTKGSRQGLLRNVGVATGPAM